MRVDNAIKNSSFALAAQMVTVIMKALTQIVFVRTLNVVYLGVNGLFSNILTMLSLAELGVGSAILYNMYKPMAQKDILRINALMNFYRETYRKIGFFVLILGMSITPFLEYIIKDDHEIPELKLIYILYVFNNAVSYFFVYKQSVLIADQKNYVVMFINIIKNVFMFSLQITFLIITKNFLIYLMISIISTIIFNLVTSIAADNYYPYLKNNKEHLEKEEKKVIYKDVYAMMAHRVGGVIVMGTDNILLSAFVGVAAVGLYSNYVMILGSVKGFLNQVYEALLSSIGDLVNSESKEKIYSVYKNMFFMSFWITSVISIGFYCLANPFVDIAFGNNYELPDSIVFLMAINFFITDLTGIRAVTNKFKTAQGLFWNDRYKPYIESIINLLASIVLLKKIGFAGILLGTLVSTLATGFWVEPFILYKYGFGRSLKEYFAIYFRNFLIYIGAGAASYAVVSLIRGNLFKILIGIPLCLIIPSFITIMFYLKSAELKYFVTLMKKIMRRKG